MAFVGYARVSPRGGQQVSGRQMDALRAAGCKRFFQHRGSAANTNRPGLPACPDYLRRAAVLVAPDRDCLGCRGGEVVRLVDKPAGCGVGFRALTKPIGPVLPDPAQVPAQSPQQER